MGQGGCVWGGGFVNELGRVGVALYELFLGTTHYPSANIDRSHTHYFYGPDHRKSSLDGGLAHSALHETDR